MHLLLFRLPLIITGSFIFLLFVIFSFAIDKDKLDNFDFDTTVRFQDNIPRTVDEGFSFLSEIGKFEPSLIILLVILVLCRRIIGGIITFGLFGFLHIVEVYGKTVVEQFPPPEFLLRTKRLVEFPQFHVRAEYSYPSGHAARAAFLTVLLGALILNSKRLKKWQKGVLLSLLIGYDILMFVSRPYLGEHWMSDVIGGILLGGGLALIGSAFLIKRLQTASQEPT